VSFGGNDIVERNLNWQKHKDQKIHQMKSEMERQQKQEWTFKPNVSPLVMESTNEWQKSFNSESVDKFIQRQQLARCKKEETKAYEEYIINGGSAWVDSYAWKAHKQKYLVVI
jgi:hypothetical protein